MEPSALLLLASGLLTGAGSMFVAFYGFLKRIKKDWKAEYDVVWEGWKQDTLTNFETRLKESEAEIIELKAEMSALRTRNERARERVIASLTLAARTSPETFYTAIIGAVRSSDQETLDAVRAAAQAASDQLVEHLQHGLTHLS